MCKREILDVFLKHCFSVFVHVCICTMYCVHILEEQLETNLPIQSRIGSHPGPTMEAGSAGFISEPVKGDELCKIIRMMIRFVTT